MKKSLHLLSVQNLKPKEIALLLIHNVIEDIRSKEVFSNKDIQIAINAWRPKNNLQVGEYNRYQEVWKITSDILINLHLSYLSVTQQILEARELICYLSFANYKSLYKLISKVPADQAIEIRQLIFDVGIDCNQLNKKEYARIFTFTYIEIILRRKEIKKMLQQFASYKEFLMQASYLFEKDMVFIYESYEAEIEDRLEMIRRYVSKVYINTYVKLGSCKYPDIGDKLSLDDLILSVKSIEPITDPWLKDKIGKINTVWKSSVIDLNK